MKPIGIKIDSDQATTDLKQWYASSVLTVLLALLLRVKVLPL